jgi:putative protease
LNAKDLCMIEHVPELIKSGIHSFKIEGRMKSAYYVAIVTKMYRLAIDRYCTDPNSYVFDPSWLQELKNVSHRPYSTGFFFGDGIADTGEMTLQEETSSRYIKEYDFVGTVVSYDAMSQMLLVQARNRIRVGAVLDVIDPHQAEIHSFTVPRIVDEQGSELVAAHNQYTVRIPCPFVVSDHSILRAAHEHASLPDAVGTRQYNG